MAAAAAAAAAGGGGGAGGGLVTGNCGPQPEEMSPVGNDAMGFEDHKRKRKSQ